MPFETPCYTLVDCQDGFRLSLHRPETYDNSLERVRITLTMSPSFPLLVSSIRALNHHHYLHVSHSHLISTRSVSWQGHAFTHSPRDVLQSLQRPRIRGFSLLSAPVTPTEAPRLIMQIVGYPHTRYRPWIGCAMERASRSERIKNRRRKEYDIIST